MFKISSVLRGKDVLDCKLYLKLFDSIVKPIALYGCPVWSQRCISYFTKQNFGNFDRLPFEALQNKLCKLCINAGKQTSNMAVRAEFGRHPLLLNIAELTINYWTRIIESPNKLVFHAYLEDKALDEAGQKNWVTLVRTILSRCNLSHVWKCQRAENPHILSKKVKSELERQHSQVFFNQLGSVTGRDGKSGNKLRTYNLLKSDYNIEPYLLARIPAHLKRAISKIRIGAHDLEVERGRWTKPKPVPASDRFCRHCKTVAETEIHFMIECPVYSQPRSDLLKNCPNMKNLDTQALFTALFGARDEETIRQVGIFICRALNKRKCLLYDTQA
jgi:hypothetical protein